jgi:hypothetical protein
VLVAAAATLGCATDRQRGGQMTASQADRYLNKAVRKSSEGVVLMPGEEAAKEWDPARLNELAQSLRVPLAGCFLDRAVTSMELGVVDGEEVYVQVPEGQIKVRARIGGDGTVVATETLELGFKDERMEPCIHKAIASKRFPPSRTAFNKHLDVVYWVSLGFFQEANTESFALHMRKETVRAGQRARPCLEGRVAPGHYEISGLNLFDREGGTLTNRVEDGPLDKEAAGCLASAFRDIRIHPEREAFVRPAQPNLVFDVSDEGVIALRDEEWLRLLEREEAALREEKRRDLLGGSDVPVDAVDGGPEPDVVPAAVSATEAAVESLAPGVAQPVEDENAEAVPVEREPDAAPGALRLRPRG